MRLDRTVCTLAFLCSLTAAGAAAGQSAAGRELPRVWVLTTGGTIAGQYASPTVANEDRSRLAGEQLVAGVPEIKKVARVDVEQIASVASSDITVAHWLALANRINAIFRDDTNVAGVVVTHGSNTLEETAYSLEPDCET